MRWFLKRVTIMILLLLILSPASGEAAWGLSSEVSAHLNLNGYDRNTVSTLTGRVTAIPVPYADPVTLTMQVGAEQFTVILGPRWYLQHDILSWQIGDSVQVRGAVARDKRGERYILVQWITQPTGSRMMLRSDSGVPGWSGGGASSGGRRGAGQGHGRQGR